MTVDRCVCHDLPFDHLLRLARQMDMDFEALRDWSGCSTGCGMCEPYVRLMLATGRTRFPVLQQVTIERMIAEAESATEGEKRRGDEE